MSLAAFRFSKWAQPVTNRRWAFVCVVLDTAKRLTRFRFRWLTVASHRAWERACGII